MPKHQKVFQKRKHDGFVYQLLDENPVDKNDRILWSINGANQGQGMTWRGSEIEIIKEFNCHSL